MYQYPQAAQKTLRTRHCIIIPLKGLIRGRRKHGEEPYGIRAVAVDQALGINAVVLGFGHRGPAGRGQGGAIADPVCGSGLAFGVLFDLDLVGPDPDPSMFVAVVIVSLGQHHALTEQLCCRFVAAHEIKITHQLVPETEIHEVQHGVLDAADVVVNRQPVIGALVQHTVGAGRAVACVVPAGFDKGIEGIGLAFSVPATFGT